MGAGAPLAAFRRKPGVAPINARAETLDEKPMFRNLIKAKRCIVPASGFYEWRSSGGRKQPYYLTSADGELWGLAGLYDATHDENNDAAGSFTIITTSANDLVAPLHERMPVILQPGRRGRMALQGHHRPGAGRATTHAPTRRRNARLPGQHRRQQHPPQQPGPDRSGRLVIAVRWRRSPAAESVAAAQA